MKSQSVLAVLIGFYASTLHGTPWLGTSPSQWGGFLQNDAADSRDKNESRTATEASRWGGFFDGPGTFPNDAAVSRDKNESRTATAADDVSCVECICKGKVAAGFKKIAGKCPMRFCQCVN